MTKPLTFPEFSQARRVRAELVTGILRDGRPVPDAMFDEIYPPVVQHHSMVHWTPVRVAARVVELLRLRPGERVLDVGAGVGKFCIVAAALSGAHVRGVEREPQFVAVAREAARRLGVDVDLVEAEFTSEDPQHFTGIYVYNPFAEPIRLPGTPLLPADRFAFRSAGDVASMEDFLGRACAGVRVVTYCGFGGAMPDDYARISAETWEEGALELWQKR